MNIKPQDSLAMVMDPPKPERRILALILGAVAAIALAYGALSHNWLTTPHASDDERYQFGPMGVEVCIPICASITNFALADLLKAEADRARDAYQKLVASGTASEMQMNDANRVLLQAESRGRISGAFAVCGILALIGSLVTAVSLAIAVVLVALKKRPDLPIMPTTTAILGLMVGIIGGCVFIAVKPPVSEDIIIAYGFWGFAGGSILGIVATLMLNRNLRPGDEDFGAGAMNADDF